MGRTRFALRPQLSFLVLGFAFLRHGPLRVSKKRTKNLISPFYLAGIELQNLSLQHQAPAETAVRLF